MEEVLSIYWFSGSTRHGNAGPSVICVAYLCKRFRFQGGQPHARQFGARQSQLSTSFGGKAGVSGGSKCDASSGFNEGLHHNTTQQFQGGYDFCLQKKVILSHIGQCMYGNPLINVRTGFRGALFLIKRHQPQHI